MTTILSARDRREACRFAAALVAPVTLGSIQVALRVQVARTRYLTR